MSDDQPKSLASIWKSFNFGGSQLSPEVMKSLGEQYNANNSPLTQAQQQELSKAYTAAADKVKETIHKKLKNPGESVEQELGSARKELVTKRMKRFNENATQAEAFVDDYIIKVTEVAELQANALANPKGGKAVTRSTPPKTVAPIDPNAPFVVQLQPDHSAFEADKPEAKKADTVEQKLKVPKPHQENNVKAIKALQSAAAAVELGQEVSPSDKRRLGHDLSGARDKFLRTRAVVDKDLGKDEKAAAQEAERVADAFIADARKAAADQRLATLKGKSGQPVEVAPTDTKPAQLVPAAKVEVAGVQPADTHLLKKHDTLVRVAEAHPELLASAKDILGGKADKQTVRLFAAISIARVNPELVNTIDDIHAKTTLKLPKKEEMVAHAEALKKTVLADGRITYNEEVKWKTVDSFFAPATPNQPAVAKAAAKN